MMPSSLQTGTAVVLPTPSGVNRELLDEETFRKAVYLEGKRAERSRRLFLLMLLDVARISGTCENGGALGNALSAISQSIRETDIMGWHEKNKTFGILFTEIPENGRDSIVNTLRRRVSGALYRSLEFDQFSHINISHHLFPEQWELDVAQRPSHPALYPDVYSEDKGSKFFVIGKRAIDILGSIVGMLLALPLFLLIVLAIKCTSRGPALFRQVRIGQYGAPFVFLKFRSMHVDNDPGVHREYVKSLITERSDSAKVNGNGRPVYKIMRDPRVTRFGAFLRKTSLDELPQLYNVLKGEMSLVGPRPAIPYEVEAYQPWHRRRILAAKPGITGLWQVKGRSRVSFDEMVRLDVRYAMARSLWLDVKILLSTPRAVLFAKGAY
jgi:lipopolysaccharide/colanic/teichoic acid biosynthesis glycosyltransferase